MNKSRILVLSAVAIAVALLGIGGAWFWSIGSVTSEQAPLIRMEVIRGNVEYKVGETWMTAQNLQEVHAGDMIKTGTDAEAQILWGDEGVTRVDQNTDLVINSAPTDISGGKNIGIHLQLNAGRIWNRMLKLLDVDSSIEVRTSDVVATVRGTTYGINKFSTCTEASVSESVVSIMAVGATEESLIADNETAGFGATDCSKPLRALTKDDTWQAEQKRKDTQFDRDELKTLRARFEARAKKGGAAPAWARDASEQAHLALASETDRQQLAIDYAKRQLALAMINPEYAKEALARIRLLLPIIGDRADALRGELHTIATLLARTRSSASDSAWIDELRLLRDAVINNKEIDGQYRELIRIDETVDDLLGGTGLPGARTHIIANLMARLDAVDAKIGQQGDARLKAKSKAVRIRVSSILGLVEAPVPVPAPIEIAPENKPIIRINEPSIQNPVLRPPTTNPKPAPTPAPAPAPAPVTPPQVVRDYETLSLVATPSVSIGSQTMKIKLFGTKADGQVDDLTSQSTFALANPTDGQLQGTIVMPILVGTITIHGSFRDAVGTRTVSTSITHSQPKQAITLQSIEIRLMSPTTVTCSASLPYKVFAIDGAGGEKDVTIFSTVSVSDQTLLFASNGSIMTFCAGQQTPGIVTAHYTELGVTKTASVTITVVPDPATPNKPSYYFIY